MQLRPAAYFSRWPAPQRSGNRRARTTLPERRHARVRQPDPEEGEGDRLRRAHTPEVVRPHAYPAIPLLLTTQLLSPRSGANYIDRILTTVSAGSSSTSAVGQDSTEHSF